MTKIPTESMFITDLSVHSIGIILFRNNRQKLFKKFCLDVLQDAFEILTLKTDRYIELEEIQKKYLLDFEDSYQLLLAKLNKLQLISFDKDFDKIEKLRKEPKEIS